MEFGKILQEYGIESKVKYAVTDNAANMKCAFTANFPLECDEQEQDLSHDDEMEPVNLLCEEELWEERKDQDSAIDIEILDLSKTERLSCFAHTLQLAVANALKLAKSVNPAITKVKSISSLLHQSSSMKVKC